MTVIALGCIDIKSPLILEAGLKIELDVLMANDNYCLVQISQTSLYL